MEETTVAKPETKIFIEHANTVYVSHPEASFGVFCFNHSGDLFLNSDWGFFGYAWRSYGKDNPFPKFLSQCNADYIVGKFTTTYMELTGKKIPPFRLKGIAILTGVFIARLKEAVDNGEEWTKY